MSNLDIFKKYDKVLVTVFPVVYSLVTTNQKSLIFGPSLPWRVGIYIMTPDTPASNLSNLAPPGQFFMGAKLFIGTSLDAKRRCLQKNWFGLCENAWFPWQPIADLRLGVFLQKYSYLSCYLF